MVRRDGMPTRRTVFRWLNTHPEFEQAYRLARTYQAEYWAEEMIEVAFDDGDDVLVTKVEKTTAAGAVTIVETPISNHARIQRDKLKIETLKTAIAHALPSKYGKTAGADAALIGTPPQEPVKKLAGTISPLSAAVIEFKRNNKPGGTARTDAPARREVQDRG